jgi:hypothetical protein
MNAPAPTAEAERAADQMTFEGLAETLDLAASFARSAAESAWRDERGLLRLHLLQLSRSTTEALTVYRALETGEAL